MAEIRLTQGKVALVDDADFEYLNQWSWHLNGTGYVVRTYHTGHGRLTRKVHQMLMHRQLLNPPKGMYVDHINHDRLDNRRSNIRVCTPQQNSQNMSIKKCNTSGFIGVAWDKSRNLWMAYSRVNGTRKHIGRFSSALEASLARDAFVKEHHGEFASINHG